jgi:hypothetical protein
LRRLRRIDVSAHSGVAQSLALMICSRAGAERQTFAFPDRIGFIGNDPPRA